MLIHACGDSFRRLLLSQNLDAYVPITFPSLVMHGLKVLEDGTLLPHKYGLEVKNWFLSFQELKEMATLLILAPIHEPGDTILAFFSSLDRQHKVSPHILQHGCCKFGQKIEYTYTRGPLLCLCRKKQ